jgi:16S rRNA (cytidine1402-2'-O)-methyltransferase
LNFVIPRNGDDKVILKILGDREIVLTQELTKTYEEVLRGKVSEIKNQIRDRKLKGEITLVIYGKPRKKTKGKIGHKEMG